MTLAIPFLCPSHSGGRVSKETTPMKIANYSSILGRLMAGALLTTLTFHSAELSAKETKFFYVSPAGDNQNPGTKDKPYKSLDATRNAVRQWKTQHPNQDITVYLRQGKYRLGQTVKFTLQDSGSDTQSITYASYPGELAEINGSRPVLNWKPLSDDSILPDRIKHLKDKIWVYSAPRIKDKTWKINTLYQGQKRLPRSRQGFAYDNPYYTSPQKSAPSPKFRKLTPEQQSNKEYISANRSEIIEQGLRGEGRFGCNELCAYLFYPKGAIRQWQNLDDIELFLFTRAEWLHEIRGIRRVDPSQRRAFFDFPTKFSTEMRQWRANAMATKYPHEFYVENAIDYMDEPGEWCVNTQLGKVFLLANEKPQNVEIAHLTECLLVEGQVEGVGVGKYRPGFTDTPVKNLHFKNLHFTKASGYQERQSNFYTHVAYDLYDAPSAMLRFRGTSHCSVENCLFNHSGAAGIRLDLYAQHNLIKNNKLHDLGRAGITLIGYSPGTKDVNKHNTIYNNHIYQIGQVQLSSVGIGIIQSGQNHVAHNTLHHFPFMGIATLGHWKHIANFAMKGQLWAKDHGFERPAYSAITRSQELKNKGNFYQFLHSKKNLIEYNELYHGCYALGDINPMYINTCSGENLIRRNLVHHSNSHSHVGTAYRTDGGSQHNHMVENIAYNCAGGFAVKSVGNRYINNLTLFDQEHYQGRHGHIKVVVQREKDLFQSQTLRNVCYTKAPIKKANVPYPTMRRWFPLFSLHVTGRNLTTINNYEKRQNPNNCDHNILYSTSPTPGPSLLS
ncbi:right-handed parallel beta-helix repeat-containing protein [Rubritalea tangerina]|uniref:right-handed parallel beta-helix repeat-containing protein n=1 Tax=Rubritalea tangerina TaxID=430798 RepID=UPI00361C750A